MANKQILSRRIDGVDIGVSVFFNSGGRGTGDGDCVFNIDCERSGMRFYCSPAELLSIGNSIVAAARVAERVQVEGWSGDVAGYVKKYLEKAC